MDVRVGLWRRLSMEELMLLNYGAEKTLESCLDEKEIKLIDPKVNQPWILIGRTDAEAEAPILKPSDAKSWFIGKDPDARKDWRQGEKGVTEDEMVGWHHWHNGHEFEQALGDSEGQGSLACCNSWGRKESDTTEWLIWSDLMNNYRNMFQNDPWIKEIAMEIRTYF